ncbi:MAG TPA: hypothetical protein VFO10_03145 [Oligoflexus sp.]|uniref:hypothetical protein n=1 Tax=Oligoflexus sp. TaxID=1971216 RepID=UPI002D80E0C3|nr:hypothetical protein [Oligoflexus sp.]HET9236220.1 hypothetical protein [Oligoflexus sp.]
MNKFSVAVGNLAFAALLTGALTACVTSAPGTSAKQTCVQQEAVVGSRLSRSTCKPAAATSTAETKPSTEVH